VASSHAVEHLNPKSLQARFFFHAQGLCVFDRGVEDRPTFLVLVDVDGASFRGHGGAMGPWPDIGDAYTCTSREGGVCLPCSRFLPLWKCHGLNGKVFSCNPSVLTAHLPGDADQLLSLFCCLDAT